MTDQMSKISRKLVFDEVDVAIIKERNEEIENIEQDILMISEISNDMGVLIHEQGEMIDVAIEKLDSATIHVNEAKEVLEKTEEIHKNTMGTLFDAATLALTIGAGAFGFFSGPIVGIPTLLVGAVVGGGIVFARRKIK